ncbi:MAG: hypothetical protein ACI4DS_00810 [Eubacterium sp.]
MNKQEKNIVDIVTYDDVEEIVDIFLDKLYNTDETVALISDKEIVKSVMNNELISDDCISIQRVDLELDDAAYMVSIDNKGRMVVQPIEYYDDKYFTAIEYAFVDMDGIVEQMTIDKLLNRDVPIVLFGCEDEYDCDDDNECDCCECTCCKDEKLATTTTSSTTYRVNGREVDREIYEKALNELDEKYLDNVQDVLLNYFDFVSDMNQWRKLLGW